MLKNIVIRIIVIYSVILCGLPLVSMDAPPGKKAKPAAASSADQNAKNIELFNAVSAINIQGVLNALDHGAELDARDSNGMSALHRAAQNKLNANAQWFDRQGHLRIIIEILLALKADAHMRDSGGRTPLHYAIANHDHAQILLEAGADPNAEDSQGSTPLHYAARQNSGGIVQATGEICGILLNAGARINARSSTGGTPLMVAAAINNAYTLRRLLHAGADVNAALPNGATSLHIAASHGHLELVAVLLRAGANVRATADGSTAFSMAEDKHHAHVALLLKLAIARVPAATPLLPQHVQLLTHVTSVNNEELAGGNQPQQPNPNVGAPGTRDGQLPQGPQAGSKRPFLGDGK